MVLSMSDERVKNVKSELFLWQTRKGGTKRQLLSLLGKLVFVSRIVRPGRIFVRRLFNATMSLKHLHHRLKLSKQTLKDIEWWSEFLETWNQKSLFYDLEWCDSNDIFFSTDASDIGYSGVLQSSWAYKEFTPDQRERLIAWRELYALVTSCFTWGHRLKGKKLYIWCDNQNIVYAVNNGTSKNNDIMALVRSLFQIASSMNFEIRLKYIPSKLNTAADLLSRMNIDRFKELYPFMEDTHTKFNEGWKKFKEL